MSKLFARISRRFNVYRSILLPIRPTWNKIKNRKYYYLHRKKSTDMRVSLISSYREIIHAQCLFYQTRELLKLLLQCEYKDSANERYSTSILSNDWLRPPVFAVETIIRLWHCKMLVEFSFCQPCPNRLQSVSRQRIQNSSAINFSIYVYMYTGIIYCLVFSEFSPRNPREALLPLRTPFD